MNIFVFDNVTGTLKIDDYTILLVKEFADLWDKNRNKCKEDKTGNNRLRAYKELTYIYLALDFKSPYYTFLPKDRHEEALRDAGLTEKDCADPIFRAAYLKYQEIRDSDPILSLIGTAYKTLYKMQVFFDGIDFNNDVDADGRPLFKPKDVIDAIASIAKVRTQIKELEAMHKKDLETNTTSIKGDVTPGLLDG